jgi:A nuclease family of the HNH/ENDO VII superfamily with conserved AHH
VVGAATSLASGILNDNLSLKGVLRGALAGALTAGLMQGVNTAFGVTAANPLSTIGSIAARTTVQGAVQALMGGKFADGALAGLASGLAEAVSANMLEGIANSGMTGAEAVAARTFARVVGSAIRTAASPGDPGQAFASAFLDDVFKQIDTGTPVTQTAFDDEGRLNLGIVDPNASPEQQAQQLAAQLQRQGIPPAQANLMAQQALGNIVDGVAQLPQRPVQTAPTQPAPVTRTEPNSPGGTTTPPTTTTPEPLWIAADGRPIVPSTGSEPVGALRPFSGDQPAFPDTSLLPAGAQVIALRDDTGRNYWRVIANDVDLVVAGTATATPTTATDDPTVIQLETVVITGRRIPRFESTDAQGNTLVTQGNAASLTTLAGTTLVATQMGEGLALGEGATTAARVLAGLARLASMPAAVLMMLFTPTNATEQFVDLAPGERFRTRPGELYGELQVQSADGRWLSMPGQVRLDQVQGRSMLSDEERDLIGAPLTTPIKPQQTPPLVTPIPTDNDRPPPLPGFEGQAPTGPTITTTPADPQNWRDLIIETRDSRELGDNLIAGGSPKPGTGYQPHHVVPINDPRAADIQRLLEDAKIDLNSAANGVWLPQNSSVPNSRETPHNETFRDSYFDYLDKAFAGATDRADIESRLRQIREDLQSRRPTLPLKKP